MSKWRNSATLLLASRVSASTSSRFDYNLLMLKRSTKSKFMPNAYVFPGGVSENSDFDPHWKDILAPIKPLEPLILKGVTRPMLMKTQTGLLEPDVGFRINAIRETFEETGILLHVPVKEGDEVKSGQLLEWRDRVHQDASQFMTMCRQLQVIPDVWSLFEWSDWLTPSSFKNQSRFDTIFYVGFSDKIPCDKAVKDKSEVSAVIWSDPEDALVQNIEEKFWLAPPQFYELSRLLNFTKFDELKHFAATRSLLGTRTWMPYMIDLKDGGISIYPQDDLYPAEPDYFGKDLEQFDHLKDVSIDELSTQTKRRNRMERRSAYDNRIDVNINDDLGHWTPGTIASKSKI